MHHLLFLLICCIWGTSFILMKYALAAFGPLGVASWRVWLGALAIYLIWRVRRGSWTLRRRDLPALILLAIVGYAVPFTLQPFVIGQVEHYAQHGSAFAGMLVSFVPLLTIVVSVPMLGVWPTARQAVGVIGGLLCMAALFAEELRQDVPAWLLVIGAVTPVCYAIANTFLKRRFANVSAAALTIAGLSLGGVMLTPVSVAAETVHVDDSFVRAILALAALGVVCTGIATYFFYTLIQRQGPLYAGMVAYIIPCVSLLLGYLDGEAITATQLVALLGAFVMVALVQTGAKRIAVPTAQ